LDNQQVSSSMQMQWRNFND